MPGYYADLAILDGNPQARIEDAAAVQQAMVAGCCTTDRALAANGEPGERASSGRGQPAGH